MPKPSTQSGASGVQEHNFSTLYTTMADLGQHERHGVAGSGPGRIRILHIVNPVAAKPESDLAVAQPVTFAAMTTARSWAESRDPAVQVRLAAAGYPEDAAVVPDGFDMLPDLQRSAMDVRTFQKARKLPVLWDILERGRDAAADSDTPAEWLIYTNVDIAPMPHFYLLVAALVRKGYDAAIINRRTIPDTYTSPGDLPFMYTAIGKSHPGLDCFVFRRTLMDRFVPSRACIGAGFVMRSLLFNLVATTGKMVVLTDAHATFHIGDDRAWANPVYADYEAFNKAEALTVLNTFCRDPALHARFVAFARQTKENWLPEPFSSPPPRPSLGRRLLAGIARGGRLLLRSRPRNEQPAAAERLP